MGAQPIPFGSKPLAPIPFGAKPIAPLAAPPAAPAAPVEDPTLSKNPVLRAAQNAGIGVAKGELSTFQGLGQLGLKATDELGLTDHQGDATLFKDPAALDPKGAVQKVAKTAEQVGEFFLPGGQGADLAKAGSFIAEHAPVAAKTINVAKKAATLGLKGGGVTAAQTGSLEKGAEAVPAFAALDVGGNLVGAGVKKAFAGQAQKAAGKLDALVGQIAQGKHDDVPQFKKALSDVDLTGVKSYKDLVAAFDSHIQGLSKGLDTVLDTHTVPKPLADLALKTKVGDQIVAHNFVEDALGQLGDLYTKTNNPTAEARISALAHKANTEGLTIRDLNDLAREHGRELSGFNANGEAASGLSKQAAENTRSGLKTTAREQFGSDLYKTVDDHLSSLISARDLAQKTSDAVTKLQQKVKARGFGEKVGRLVYQVADSLTGHGLSGFVRAAIPRGNGFKVMNALDLEARLGKNLSKFEKLVGSDDSEAALTKKLQDFLKENQSQALPASQPISTIASKTDKKIDIQKGIARKPKDGKNTTQ